MLAVGGNAQNRNYTDSGWVPQLMIFFSFFTLDQFAVVKLNN